MRHVLPIFLSSSKPLTSFRVRDSDKVGLLKKFLLHYFAFIYSKQSTWLMMHRKHSTYCEILRNLGRGDYDVRLFKKFSLQTDMVKM